MTEERMALAELVQKAGEGNFLRAVAEAVLQILMEADVEGLVGAARHERSPDRLNLQALQRHRRAGPGLPGTAAGGRVALSVARRYLPQ